MGRGSSPALALCLLALLATPASGDAAPICDGHWRAYPTHLGRSGNALHGVAVLNTHDAWAVGYQQPPNGTQGPLIEHWDGAAWGPMPVPDVAGPSNVLNDADALAANDAWAVGRLGHGADSTLILHWDGTSWSIVPGATGVDGRLFGVSMVTADDVWAVGTQNVGDKVETLAEHWDGSSWTVVPTPNPGHNFNYLLSVSAASSTSVLAAGRRQGLYTNSTLIEHWDGSQWRVVPVRRRGSLGGVWTPDGQRGWAAGPPVLRSDGSTWAPDDTPEPAATFNGVSGRTTDGGVWAVGSRTVGRPATTRTAMIRWTGSRWIAAPIPSPANYQNVLEGVAASEPFVWAVGYTENKTVIRKALILGVC